MDRITRAPAANPAFTNPGGGLVGTIVGWIGAAIDQFISDLVYDLKGATGGLFDLTGFLKKTQQDASKAAAEAAKAVTKVDNQGTIIGTIETTVDNKADELAIPTNMPYWTSVNQLEDPSFPRILLNRAPKLVTTGASSGKYTSLKMFSTSNDGGMIYVSHSPFYSPAKGVAEVAIIRAPRARSYSNLSFIIGAVSNPCQFYVAAYRMDSVGDFRKQFVSEDLTPTITTQKTQLSVAFDADKITEAGQTWAVVILQTGNGNVRPLGGVEMDDILAPPLAYPPRMSATRGGLSALPATLERNTLDFLGTTWVPWVSLGEPVPSVRPAALTYADAFSGSTLSGKWAKSGSLVLRSGAVGYPTGWGETAGVRRALHIYPLNWDDVEVGVIAGATNGSTANEYSGVILRSTNDGDTYAFFAFNKSRSYIGRVDPGGATTVRSGGPGVPNSGQEIRFRAVGNVYTAFIDDVEVLSWTDSGNLVPTGDGHRFVGFRLQRYALQWSADLDLWTAKDLPPAENDTPQ